MTWIIAIALASSATSTSSIDDAQGWETVGIYNALTGDTIYELESNVDLPDKRNVNARVILTGPGIEFHSFVRNCTPDFYDYRQNFVIQHDENLDRQISKLSRLASQVMDELQNRCSLPDGASTKMMANFGSTFRKAWMLNRGLVDH